MSDPNGEIVEVKVWPRLQRRTMLGCAEPACRREIASLTRITTTTMGMATLSGATLRIAGLWMSDEEMRHVAAEFASMLQPFMSGPTGPDQKRRVLRTIILPGVEPDER